MPPATATNPWDTTIHISLDGAAGDWILFYHELPQPMPRNVYEHVQASFNATGQGLPFGVVTSLPTPTFLRQDCCNISRPYPNLWRPTSVDPAYLLSTVRVQEIASGVYSQEWSFGISIGDAPNWTRSTAFVVGATTPWHLDLTLQLSTPSDASPDPHAIVGSLAEPSYLHRGSGMTFEHYAEIPEALPALPLGYTGGRINGTFHVDSPGWTHIQYDWTNPVDRDFGMNWQDPTQSSTAYRTGTHEIDFQFPNGYHYIMTPASTDTGFGPVTWPYPLREVGAQNDVPGDVRIHAFRLDNSTDVGLSIMHLPIGPADWPQGLQQWNYHCHQLEPGWHDPMGGSPSNCSEERTSAAPDADNNVIP